MNSLIYLILVCLINYNAAQLDTSFCDLNTLPTDPANLPVPDVAKTESYQAYIERNDIKRSISEDILEYFDGKDNVGVARIVSAQTATVSRTYSYYRINEIVSIINGTCSVSKLNETYQFITPFYLITVNGEEKIVSPLSFLFLSDSIKFVYTGSSNFVRGIPVNEWQTCVYNTNSVQRFTYSFTNPDKWAPASINQQYNSIPVQVVIESKELSGEINKETYSITQFKPYLTLQEEDYFTPPGVYCPGRTSILFIPELPKTFQLTREVVVRFETNPSFDKVDGYVTTTREQYDYEYQLLRYSIQNTTMNYIHDFKTGLNYKFDYLADTCEVTKLTDEIKDENIFFDFNNADYQYTGRRVVDGVNTDVWIGQKMYKGENVLFEWCFLADGWTRIDQTGDNAAVTPILLTIFFPPGSNGQPRKPQYHHFYNYHSTNEILLNHDISKCSNTVGRKRFAFSLPAVSSQIVDGYRILFETATIKKLQQLAKVNVLRISQLKIANDQDGVYILFSLNEKSTFYGDNANIEDDVSLNEAFINLKDSFKKQFDITFQPPNSREIGLYINAYSFGEVEDNQDGYIQIKKLIYDQGYTSSDVAAFTIIITIFGLMVGILLIVLHKFNKIKIPLL